MNDNTADVLMITYNRAEYVRLSLPRLLETCGENVRVWLWHNGLHEETLEVVRSYGEHPRVHRFHHSVENVKLTEPTNWLWTNSTGGYLGKVDDDCLVPDGWVETLMRAHEANPELGVIGCWHFLPEDVDETALAGRIEERKGHRILRNCWIGGSGYLLKRKAQLQHGLLPEGQSWPRYVLGLSARKWVNGWYYPFLFQEHMDDPRSPHTQFRTDEDVRRMGGLTAQMRGVGTIAELLARQQVGVQEILTSSLDARDYVGWRAKRRRALGRVKGWMKKLATRD